MSANWSEDVKRFMVAMGQQVQDSPIEGPWTNGQTVLYEDLMREEFEEFFGSVFKADFVDGAIDLIWVTLGWLHSVGVDPQPIWDAVAAANMAKSTGPVRDDGKRLKPEGWTHPDIAALIDQQRKAGAN